MFYKSESQGSINMAADIPACLGLKVATLGIVAGPSTFREFY